MPMANKFVNGFNRLFFCFLEKKQQKNNPNKVGLFSSI